MRQKKVKTCWCCATDDRSNQQQQILTALSRSFFLDNFNVQCRHRHKDALRAPLHKKLLPLGSRSSALRRRAFFFLFYLTLCVQRQVLGVSTCCRGVKISTPTVDWLKKRQREKEEVKMAGRWIEYLHAAARLAHKVLSFSTTTTAQVPVISTGSLQKFPWTPLYSTNSSSAYPFSSFPMHPKNVTFP